MAEALRAPSPWFGLGLPPEIESKIGRVTESGCWEWSAAKTNGYGVVSRGGRLQRAHRVVYEILVGPIPSAHELDHVAALGCTTRACVNPDHLEPVTGVVNNARSNSASALHARQTHCKRGHAFTPENTYVAHRERGKRERFCRTCSRGLDRARYERRKRAC